MKKIVFEIVSCIFIVAGMIGCASKPGFSGESELSGVVLDEKNNGIEDFVVTCITDGSETFTTVTNENGIFVFSNMKCGKYEISGEKTGYGRIVKEKFNFNRRGKILCCKVNSLEGVLMSVDNQIKIGNYVTAKKLLNEVCFEEGTPMEAAVLFYMGYVDIKLGEYEACEEKIKRIKVICNCEFSEPISMLEEMLYENKN